MLARQQKQGRRLCMKYDVQNIDLKKILKIEFYKRDELTIDLICCEITFYGECQNEIFFFHEEALEWSDILKKVCDLPNFDKNWREKVVLLPFAENRTTAFIRNQ